MTEMEKHATLTFDEAIKYIQTLEKSLTRKSRFNNDLLYGMAAMGFEKLFVSMIARKGLNATHHTPMALYQEANGLHPLPEYMNDTAKLLGKFESICSMDGFGYKTPTDDELKSIIEGLVAIRQYMLLN
jgi:hypothetical protein